MWNSAFLAHPYIMPLRPSVIIAGPPEAELVCLTAMREYLRIAASDTTNDDRITSFIVSARIHAERHTHRSFAKKPYLMSLARFPNVFYDRTDKINLWYPPLTGEVSIKYIDTDGVEQTLISGKDFQVDFAGEPGRVAPPAQQVWPPTKWGVLNAVRIFYTAGYESASDQRLQADAVSANVEEPEIEAVDQLLDSQVATWTIDRTIPNDLVNAVMQLVAHWHQNRVPVQTVAGAGGVHAVLPWHVEKILDDYVFETLTPTVSPEF